MDHQNGPNRKYKIALIAVSGILVASWVVAGLVINGFIDALVVMTQGIELDEVQYLYLQDFQEYICTTDGGMTKENYDAAYPHIETRGERHDVTLGCMGIDKSTELVTIKEGVEKEPYDLSFYSID